MSASIITIWHRASSTKLGTYIGAALDKVEMVLFRKVHRLHKQNAFYENEGGV